MKLTLHASLRVPVVVKSEEQNAFVQVLYGDSL